MINLIYSLTYAEMNIRMFQPMASMVKPLSSPIPGEKLMK
jgi:hypothetical protein